MINLLTQFAACLKFKRTKRQIWLESMLRRNPHVIFDVISVESPAQHHVLLNRLGRRIAGASNLL